MVPSVFAGASPLLMLVETRPSHHFCEARGQIQKINIKNIRNKFTI